MASAIALIDADSFYCSCEKIFNGQLVGRPLCILSNNDGCVIARDKASKALGISIGTPAFQIRELAERHNIAILSSNYELYGDLSNRLMACLGDFTPEMEIYSIDEAWLRFPVGKGDSLAALGHEIKRRVRQNTGLPVSIGFGSSKTLAKCATYHAKRSDKKTRGVLDLTNSPYLELALEQLPVEEIWGIGDRYAALLRKHGINTALDLRDADDKWVREHLTIIGLKTVHELRGAPCFPLEVIPPARKNISCSRTFGNSTENFQEVRAAVAYFTMRAAERLRWQKLVAGSLMVFISTDRFRHDDLQYSANASLDVAPKSDYTPELVALALKGLSKIFRGEFKIRRAGIMLGALELAERTTRPLWDGEQFESQRRLMQAIDSLNRRFGRDTVRCGIYQNEGLWKTRFAKMSPRYTTRWEEICMARAL